ncbi:hypothetical protein ACS0TY_009171 [Phlomoides rotata]
MTTRAKAAYGYQVKISNVPRNEYTSSSNNCGIFYWVTHFTIEQTPSSVTMYTSCFEDYMTDWLFFPFDSMDQHVNLVGHVGDSRELEKGVRKLLPGTNIFATPYINSKIHVWKKEYGALSDLLSKSGIGWNSTTSIIEVGDEAVWDGCKWGIRFKTWPYYPQWIEIFGKDRATGEYAVDPIDLVNKLYRNVMEKEGETAEKQVPLTREVLHKMEDNNICKPTNYTVKTLNKGKKRKNSETDLTNLVDSLGEFMKTSTVAMGDYGKGIEKKYPSSYETTKLDEIMKGIVGLKVSNKLKVCDELIQTLSDLSFSLAYRLMSKRSTSRCC